MFNYNRMESMIAQSGKTKLHLCRAMGVSKTYLRDAKKQGTDISGEKLQILAAELNTTPEYLRGETDDPAIKKAPGINAEGFVPTMRDWEEQAESWTDDQILQAMQKLVEIQQRRRSDGR